MKDITEFIAEKMSDKEYFLNDYSFFISLIANVELSKKQLYSMFTNIPEKSLKYWADEIESVTAGTNDEITAEELMSGNVHYEETIYKNSRAERAS